MTTELQKRIDTINNGYEQWLEQVQSVSEMIDNRIQELDEPLKTNFMLEIIKGLRESLIYNRQKHISDCIRYEYDVEISRRHAHALSHMLHEKEEKATDCLCEATKCLHELSVFEDKEGCPHEP